VTLRCKGETIGWEGLRGYVKNWNLQGCSPHLCQLRTDGLALASKYWMYRSHTGVYGPSEPSSYWPIDTWLYPHYFIGWHKREIGYGPVDRSVDVLWIVLVVLFLRSSGPTQLCWWLCERLPHVDHMRYVWSWILCGPSVKSVWHVDRVFPCRVYINLNCHDYYIWVITYLW
jgi:hypothetical protein